MAKIPPFTDHIDRRIQYWARRWGWSQRAVSNQAQAVGVRAPVLVQGAETQAGPASAAELVTVATDDFDGLLSSADANVQQALETLDNHVHPYHIYYGASSEGDADYVITPTPAATAYYAGMLVLLLADVNNSTTATIDVSGLGVKNIKLAGGGSLNNGSIRTGGVHLLGYDGTEFQLVNQLA